MFSLASYILVKLSCVSYLCYYSYCCSLPSPNGTSCVFHFWFIFNSHCCCTSATMASGGRDPQGQMSQIQRQIQQDWANREYIELMTCSIKKITDFLNAFGT